MSRRTSFQLVLLCTASLAILTPAYSVENIFGTDGNDSLAGTSGGDEIVGGNGNDVLAGKGGDDVLLGGNGDDLLLGGTGDDVLFGGRGIDRLYGGPGADRFVYFVDTLEIDEVMDFNPEQNDTVFLKRKYSDIDINSASNEITADDVRIDDAGDVEIRLNHSDWTRVIRLHEQNLELNSQELTEGLLLTFRRRF